MDGLEFVSTYIDDLLCLTKHNWTDHLTKLDEVLKRVQNAGLKVNASKSYFGRSDLEYLGYRVTRGGIQPIANKVTAISAIAAPTNRKQLCCFLGMINYYRDFCLRCSKVFAPLTALTSDKSQWKWTELQDKAFTTIKQILSREVLLSYPAFTTPFEIHTDASNVQLGAVISQNGLPIAFYSRKLTPAQTRYTTTEHELLAIVETLKEFRNILLGQQLTIYTDHKNLTHKTFNTNRVMRWQLLLEVYKPTLHYIKGERKVVADAFSRLDLHPVAPNNNLAKFMNAEPAIPASSLPL